MILALSTIDFDGPIWLTALVILPVLGALSWWSATGQGTVNRSVSLVLRVLAITCFVLALAGLVVVSQVDTREVIVLADTSSSIVGNRREALLNYLDKAHAASGERRFTVVPFASEIEAIGSDGQLPGAAGDGTNLERAAAFARAHVGEGHVARLVLISDGRQTAGDLLRAAALLGMPLDVVALPDLTTGEVGLVGLSVPRETPRGSAYSVTARIASTKPGRGEIVLKQGSAEVSRLGIELTPPVTSIDIRSPAAESQGSSMPISVALAGFEDLVSANNQLTAAIPLANPSPLLLVSSASSSALASALQREGFAVTRRAPGPDAIREADRQAYSVVFLDGVAPQQLTDANIAALKKYVGEEGGGLVVAGGDDTFGLAHYEGSPLESLLPVRAAKEVKKEERPRTLALLLVIDRSQSMLEEQRLALAKEAARRAVSLLSPTDQVGVIAFGSKYEWISPLGPVGDNQRVLAAIDGLQAEGLTQMYPALIRGAIALKLADADRRHLIVLTDGVPTPDDFDGVARSLAASDVSVATVTVSKGADQALMKDIAKLAKGKHFHAENPADLAGILEREAKAAVAETSVSQYEAQPFRRFPRLSATDAPPLKGYVTLSPKQETEILLLARRRDPLLSWWRYGSGMTVAFASQTRGDWGSPWENWKGLAPFWGRIARHAARPPVPPPQVDISWQGKWATVAIDARIPGGRFEGAAQGSVVRRDARGEGPPTEFPLSLVAPYRLEARVPIESASELAIQVVGAAGPLVQARMGVAPPPAAEDPLATTDVALLREAAAISGGKFDPKPEELFAGDGRGVEVRQPLTTWLALAGLLLLVADVSARRWVRW